jgi:sulfate/thiosulfate transport system substrate-binding protein
MLRRLLIAGFGLYGLAAATWVFSAGFIRDEGGHELLNVACDPTRELWAELNTEFLARYEQSTGRKLAVKMSHGGSATQAGLVINGLKADVVTLALFNDTDALRKVGLIEPGWEKRFENRSLPFVSTIVFVVRKGNPKQIHDWPDLARDEVRVVTPNPRTSGNGKWSFLSMWGSAIESGMNEEQARNYVASVFRNVRNLDGSARAATMTFQKGIGDVHLTWENEAYLEVQESNSGLEIVYPSRSILAEPHVAIVDANTRERGTIEAATAYLKFLYTEPAQRIIAKHHYRPTQLADVPLPSMPLFPITAIAPYWDSAHQRFFSDGGEFDRVMTRRGQ